MKKTVFEKLPGLVGRRDSAVTLKLIPASYKQLKQLTQMLTLRNKSVAYRLKKVEDTAGRLRGEIGILDSINTPKDSGVYIKKYERLLAAEQEAESLKGDLFLTMYADNGDDTLTVPAGYWWLCDRIEDDSHLNIDIKPHFLPNLRPYQVDALKELYRYKRATVVFGTGLGKSLVISSICVAAVNSGKRVLVIVPTEYLVDQMYQQIKLLHENTTALGGNYKHLKLGWDICISTVNSAIKVIDQAEVIITDEAHRNPTETLANLLSNSEAEYVYSLTATPFRADGLDLAIHAFGGPTVFDRDAKWGIENKWLTPVRVIQVRLKTKNKLWKDTPSPRAFAKLSNDPAVMRYIHDRIQAALGKNHRVMCIYKTVKSAMVLRKFCRNSIPFDVAHANKKLSKKPKIPLQKFQKGETNLLVACDKLVGEGVDIPNASLMILNTQNASNSITLQCLGRILRLSEGKEIAVLIDIALMGYEQFERAANTRLEVYKYLTDDVTVLEA